MGQASSKEAGASAYMLANGLGKQRANLRGDARPIAEWRTLILSTGEVGLADKVGEDRKGNPVPAGQQIRIIDLEADANKGLGIFEDIHDQTSAADFARLLKRGAESYYGYAGPQFVTELAKNIPAAKAEAERLVDEFVERYRPRGKIDGQIERVLRKFALLAAAGELAISYGIVPWAKEVAMKAVGQTFLGWMEARGTTGSLEADEAVRHVRAYLEAHPEERLRRGSRLRAERSLS